MIMRTIVYKLILFWVFSQAVQVAGHWDEWWKYKTGTCSRSCKRGVIEVRECYGPAHYCEGTNARMYFVSCTGDRCELKQVDAFPLILILTVVFSVLLTGAMTRIYYHVKKKEKERKEEEARRRFSYENPAFWKY